MLETLRQTVTAPASDEFTETNDDNNTRHRTWHQRIRGLKARGKISQLGLVIKDQPNEPLRKQPESRSARSLVSQSFIATPPLKDRSPGARNKNGHGLFENEASASSLVSILKPRYKRMKHCFDPQGDHKNANNDNDDDEDDDDASMILGDEYLHIANAIHRHSDQDNVPRNGVFDELAHRHSMQGSKSSDDDDTSLNSFITAQSSNRASSGPASVSQPATTPNQVETLLSWNSDRRGLENDQNQDPSERQDHVSPNPHDSAIVFDEAIIAYVGKGKNAMMDSKSSARSEAQKDSPIDVVVQLSAKEEQQWQRASQRPACEDVSGFTFFDSFDETEYQQLLAIQKELDEQDREAERLARLRECAVCGDNKDVLKFPASGPTLSCKHKVHTCDECLANWIAAEFESKGCKGIKCPECPQVLNYEDVARAAAPEVFTKYDKISTTNTLSQLSEFAWCLRSGCKSGQLNINNNHYMKCTACDYQQCLKHRIEWHKNETCDQYDYRVSGRAAREREKKSEAWIEQHSKQCPNPKCGWRIQKADGCDHMVCRRCRHDFCWICMAGQEEIRKKGNTAHQTWCKYHSDNLEVTWPFNAH